MKQLILVIEANNQTNTDRAYIDKAIHCFFDVASVRLQYVNMDGKYNYKSDDVLHTIISFIRMNGKDASYVVYFFDKDSTSRKDRTFLEEASCFCRDNKYGMVVFNRTVEEVFWQVKVKSVEKKMRAKSFAQNGNPLDLKDKLSQPNPAQRESDMLLVLRRLLSPNKKKQR